MLKLTACTSPLASASASSSAVSAAVIASGFSQTTCLPASSAARACGEVQLVGRGDVDDVDALVGEHRLEALVGLGQHGGLGLGPRALGRGADHPVHLHAEPAQRLDVHDADEPGADDRRAKLLERGHEGPPESLGAKAKARAGLSTKIVRASSSPSSRASRGRKRANA